MFLDKGIVKFAPRSFLKPYLYISGEETTYNTTEYQKYFTGQTNSGSAFRVGLFESFDCLSVFLCFAITSNVMNRSFWRIN